MRLESQVKAPQKEVYILKDVLSDYIDNPESISMDWHKNLNEIDDTEKAKYYSCVKVLATELRRKIDKLCLNWSGLATVNARLKGLAMDKSKELVNGSQPQFNEVEIDSVLEGLDGTVIKCRDCLKEICQHRPYNIPVEDVQRRKEMFNPYAS